VLARAPAQASSILLSSSTGLIQRQLLNYFQTRLPNPPTHPCVPDSLVPTLADYLRSSLNPCSVDPRGTDDVDHFSRTSHQQLLLCLYTVGKCLNTTRPTSIYRHSITMSILMWPKIPTSPMYHR
jgi:hypothetical protein